LPLRVLRFERLWRFSALDKKNAMLPRHAARARSSTAWLAGLRPALRVVGLPEQLDAASEVVPCGINPGSGASAFGTINPVAVGESMIRRSAP